MSRYLGVDIGGTSVKLGLCDNQGHVLVKSNASVSFDGYKTPILTSVLSAVRSFLLELGLSASDFDGVGISATGQIDSENGVVIGAAGHIPNWIGTDLKSAFAEVFSAPIFVENDANSMALGEGWIGAAKGCTDYLAIAYGTGIGGGIVSGGRLLRGSRGIAGEVGHISLDYNGPRCYCGRHGCYENMASALSLLRTARAVLGRENLTGEELFALAQDGNEAVLEILSDWTDKAAMGLISLVHIFNPKLIVIGGGVSEQHTLFLEPLAARVRAGVMPAFAQGLEIKAAALGNDAGLVGAVSLLTHDLS